MTKLIFSKTCRDLHGLSDTERVLLTQASDEFISYVRGVRH